MSKVTEGDRPNSYKAEIVGFDPQNKADAYRGAFRVDTKDIDRIRGESIRASVIVIEGTPHVLLNKPDLFGMGVTPIYGHYRFLRGMLEFQKK